MLEIKNYQDLNEFIPYSLISVPKHCIINNISFKNSTKPTAESQWEHICNLSPNFEWNTIWRNGMNCKLFDHSDRDL